MALYFNLPVYKAAYSLLVEIYKRAKVFEREYKYTIGEELKKYSLEMIIGIYQANKSEKKERLKFIDNARQNVEIIRLCLRLTKDLKIIGVNGFAYLNIKIEELSKQLTSWHKYTARVDDDK
jgi:four helix bundle protein